jgi:hypothetical protein
VTESNDFEQRARLGKQLAVAAGEPDVDERLLSLLLDPHDTAVTYRTALALLERRDLAGLRLIVKADALADDDTGQWLSDAIGAFRARSLGTDDDFLLSALTELSSDSDQAVQRSARDLLRAQGFRRE